MAAAVVANDAHRDAKHQAERSRNHLRLRPRRAESGADAIAITVAPGPDNLQVLARGISQGRAAGIHRAATVAITFANTPSALRVLHSIHELEPTLPTIVRTVDDADLEKLIASGATEVIPEIVEGSLMLASHTLVLMGVPMRRVVRRVEEMRDERYSMLRGYFHGADEDDDERREQVRLQSVPVDENADAVGRTLDELGLVGDGVEVTAIRRHGIRGVEPDPDTKLRASDIVVLRGLPEALQQAEERLSRNRRAGAVA